MTTAAEYRDYAKECMHWASEAKTEEERKACLALARQWLNAAYIIDVVEGPTPPAKTGGQPPWTRH